MNIRFVILPILLLSSILAARLTVEPQGDSFVVKRDGNVLIESVIMETDIPMEQANVQTSQQTMADGTRVWERWCEDRDNRFRLEVAERADGAVEITMTGEIDALSTNLTRNLALTMPTGCLADKEFQALADNGRAWRPVKGRFTANSSGIYRWLACDGLTFDFNPIGPIDDCSMYRLGAIKGIWRVWINNGALNLQAGSTLPNCGGFTGTKLVLREGVYEDYDSLHSVRLFTYSQALPPVRLFSFGDNRVGRQYTPANLPFDAKRGFGWTDGKAVPAPRTGSPEGAYYAHVHDKGTRTFRVAGLQKGFHIVTVGAGNFGGESNRFRIAVGAEELARDTIVQPRSARIFSRVIHVQDGQIDITLEGEFLLSVIAVQALLYDGEDFAFHRGFWVADGYEPGVLYRNEFYRKPPVFATAEETLVLPVPGTELAAHPREPERPVLRQDLTKPQFAWLRNVKSVKLLKHSSSMAELDAPGLLDRFLDQLIEGKQFTSIELSGMHTRQIYFGSIERGKEAIGRIAKAAHQRGLKLIDHHSTTLLRNCGDCGLRVLAVRLPETCRTYRDHLPSFQSCISTPEFRKTCFGYLADLVRRGVDGFQLDEFNFWKHSCACQHCREAFHRATGCHLPMNELDPCFNNPDSELWRRWVTWQDTQVTAGFIAMRQYLAPINPDVVFRNYSTHGGAFTRSRRSDTLGWDLFDESRALDWVGTETMTRNVIQTSRSLIPFRRTQNVFHLATGMPVDAWYYVNDWPSSYFAWGVANMTCQTGLMPAQLVQKEDDPDYERFSARPVNMKREGTTAVAEIALLFSTESRDWNRLVGYPHELYGIAQTMERLHLPYEFLGSMSLDDKHLSKYKALVVAAAGCVTDRQIRTIRSFAERGGMVYLTTVAGLFDQYGTFRQAWPFADLFGFSPCTKSLPKVKEVSADGCTVKLGKPLPTFLPRDAKGNPLRLTVPCGKGKIVYCALPIASEFYELEARHMSIWKYNPDPDLEALYQDELADLFAPFRHWTINAPSKVFTSIWREPDGALVVHLLNGLGACMKPGDILVHPAPEPAFPPIPQDITFTLPASNCHEVLAYSPEFDGSKALAFTVNTDAITVTVPKGLFQTYLLIRLR
ncbi:MAG: hypothetical protein IKP00_07780 [Victivallales bacterium]|nr:hypothetical protein [Victivallales bacterium]